MAGENTLNVGDRAPDFHMETDDGRQIRLDDFKGRNLVLYFYPKDDTPGCTNEAIAFSSLEKEFGDSGAEIVGVSKDSVSSHGKFRTKHSLTITLASDPDGATCESFGVWVEKKMYGRTYMGIERSTFLIAEDGSVRQIWRKVRVPGHAEKVLEALKS